MKRSWQLRMHWLTGYGIPRTALRLLARSGDPVAKLLIDTSQAGNVSALTEQIRARGPISSFARTSWVTADAHVMRQILRDNRFRTVKPRDRSRQRPIKWVIAKTNPGLLNPLEPPSMLFVDQPEHTRLRRLVMRGFTPRAIDGLRARIQQVADRELDALANESQADLVAAYTARIPIAVIAAMLGIPDDDVEYLRQISAPGTRLVSSAYLRGGTTSVPCKHKTNSTSTSIGTLNGCVKEAPTTAFSPKSSATTASPTSRSRRPRCCFWAPVSSRPPTCSAMPS